MSIKPNICVLIIHGAVIRASTRRWMNLLKAHLLRSGVPDVRLFYWSGRANFNAIDEAGANLSNDLVRWFPDHKTESGQSLRVFAKSSGGLVFRSALRQLAERSFHLSGDTLLQVAVPNPTITEATICSVKKIVNLYSRSDWFLRAFLKIGPYKGYRQVMAKVDGNADCNYIHNVELPALGHDEFNWNTLLRRGKWAERNLYDVYFEILSD